MIAPLIASTLIACLSPKASDGDTIRCAGHKTSLRLATIDAPETPGSPLCRQPRKPTAWCDFPKGIQAREYMNDLLRSGTVTYRITGKAKWFRDEAKVYVNGRDVECLMVAAGMAKVRYAVLRGCE